MTRISLFSRNALSLCAIVSMLAGCRGGAAMPPGLSAAQRIERTSLRPAYNVLYSFENGTDGLKPVNLTLTNVNGTLYGVTEGGGNGSACPEQCGTVFTLSTSGAESVLYNFQGGAADGGHPKGGLVERNGVLYGTTQDSGKYGAGTFFKITASGKETVLHHFGAPIGGGYDGAHPYAALIFGK